MHASNILSTTSTYVVFSFILSTKVLIWFSDTPNKSLTNLASNSDNLLKSLEIKEGEFEKTTTMKIKRNAENLK